LFAYLIKDASSEINFPQTSFDEEEEEEEEECSRTCKDFVDGKVRFSVAVAV